jgi:hypothetical protein
MKSLYLLLFTLLIIVSSCSTSDDSDNQPINEIEDLLRVQELENESHIIELYTDSGKFYTGYNHISLRIKNKISNQFETGASLTWMPVMQMPTMQHSCPKSGVAKALGKDTAFEGFIIFQMTNADASGWSLKLDYQVNGEQFTVTENIEVFQHAQKNVTAFIGSDNARYVLANIGPKQPIIGNNDLTLGLYKMENMMTFPVVNNYTITLDPRMPGMGNHGSPNNTDLTYSAVDNFYHGNLSLTMTGYWVLNFQLLNGSDEVLKGEPVTDENIQSSLFLELEF